MEEILLMLQTYGQEHLIAFYDQLNDDERKHLVNQINMIDFNLVESLYESINDKREINSVLDMKSYETSEVYYNVGLESVKRGEYAVMTMAGGQGTRLGYDGPKGTYKLEYGVNKSLFEIQCDKLKHLYDISGVYTPWYIMTSVENDIATKKFFEDNNYFNYPKDKIIFFGPQEEIPMIDKFGKIVMDSKYNIKMGANGHGGVFKALVNSKLINKMEKAGIKWIFIGGIDNILLPINNPDLIGFTIEKDLTASSKIVKKAYPEEKVGVFSMVNGKPGVIEYIEMTPEMNALRYSDGSLVYGDAHILCNLFNISILKDISKHNLKYYGAFKKTNYIDSFGNLVVSEEPCAYKFETFLFDAFGYVDDVGLLVGVREEIFAPIKNATGNDSPETAFKLYSDYHKKYDEFK
jgi:UDP-N-acetylglucosamine/UDP-N-acetylgalactosamine diphosphorylase